MAATKENPRVLWPGSSLPWPGFSLPSALSEAFHGIELIFLPLPVVTGIPRCLITACSLESASGQSGKTPGPYLLQQFSVKFGIIILFWSEALLFVCHTKEMGTSIEEAGDLCL